MRQNPHVRICGGPGSATTLVYPTAHSAELGAWMAERVLAEDTSVPWMTVKKALRETDALLQGTNDEDACLLKEVNGFLYDRAEQVAAGG